VIESNGFTINPTKSRLQIPHCRQEVTGIGVNVFPNVNRALIRELRAMLHAWERYGFEDAEREFRERFAKPDRRPGSGEPSFRRVVKGKLDFIQMVRGRNDPVYVKLRAKLHELEPGLVGAPPAPLPRSGRPVAGVGADPGWTRWYQRLRQSIFHLEMITDKGVNSGTAFAYRTTHLATAAHNLTGEVRLRHATGQVVVSDWEVHGRYEREGVDCALVRFEHGVSPLSVSPHLPSPGQPVAIIGFASVPQRHPSLGIYPGTVESINDNYYGTSLIHISVSAAGGLSGSPVINASGQVIGIVVESTFEQTQPGVPSREFCAVLPIDRASELSRG
jgi:S1-C subfamily serine protease